MKRRTAITAVGALALAGTHSAFAQQPIVIKFSHVVTNDTPKGKGANRMSNSCSTRRIFRHR